MEIFLFIYLAGAAPSDARHPDDGRQPSFEVCESKRDRARAAGHRAKCVVFSHEKRKQRTVFDTYMLPNDRDPRIKARLYVWPKDSYMDDELQTSDYLSMDVCEDAAKTVRAGGDIAHCRTPFRGAFECAHCGAHPEFPPG